MSAFASTRLCGLLRSTKMFCVAAAIEPTSGMPKYAPSRVPGTSEKEMSWEMER